MIKSNSVVGQRFKTSSGIWFGVIEGETYSQRQITKRYREYLTSLRPDVLISIAFYGKPTPLITTKNGVVRLTKVLVNGKIYTGSTTVSQKLGVKETKKPVALTSP